MRQVKITTKCEEGICPICGGRLYYLDSTPDYNPWQCCTCSATGKEGKEYDSEGNAVFDGKHYEVHLNCGIPVIIEDAPADVTPEPEPEPITIVATCKEDICPICGGKTELTGDEFDYKYGIEKEWKCPSCGAKGYGRYQEETLHNFAGEHVDVVNGDGVPVQINPPELPKGRKTWKIPVSWEMCGYVHIDAPTLAEAMEKVRSDNDDIPLPAGDYVDGSFCLSYEEEAEIRDLHNNGQPDAEVQ